jgi:hypothetical protein
MGERPFLIEGIRFQRKTACLTAIGQSWASAVSGQWMAAWIIIDRATAMIVWIVRSAIPL